MVRTRPDLAGPAKGSIRQRTVSLSPCRDGSPNRQGVNPLRHKAMADSVLPAYAWLCALSERSNLRVDLHDVAIWVAENAHARSFQYSKRD
jgi:hypothetical protein